MPMPFMVWLDEARVLLAEHYAAKVMASGIESRPNFPGTYIDGRYVVGYLGEFAVEDMLKAFGIAYTYNVELRGQSSPAEFTVCLNDGPARSSLEVKTRSNPNAKEMLIPPREWNRATPFLVGARIEERTPTGALVAVMGCITRAEACLLPTGMFKAGNPPARFIPFHDMHSIRELVQRLAPVRRVLRSTQASEAA